MYVGLREIKDARGRFALITIVIVLMTLLVGFLSGLTGGLAEQNISAFTKLKGNHFLLSLEGGSKQATVGDSSFTEDVAEELMKSNLSVKPEFIGLSQLSVSPKNDVFKKTGVTLWASSDKQVSDSDIVISQKVADSLGVKRDSEVRILNQVFTVSEVTEDVFYSHTPLVYVSLKKWQKIHQQLSGQNVYSSFVVSDAELALPSGLSSQQISSIKRYNKFSVLPLVGAFRSEIGSLGMMIGMLYFISMLVVGAFFLVWMTQRRYDIAVLKSLGADTRSLVGDAVSQSVIILGIGVLVGSIIVWVSALAVQGSGIPFMLNGYTLLLPGVLLFLTGLIGSVVSLQPVVKSDPNTALGGVM